MPDPTDSNPSKRPSDDEVPADAWTGEPDQNAIDYRRFLADSNWYRLKGRCPWDGGSRHNAGEWFCLCWNYLRHRKLNPASKPRCDECGMKRPC